MSSLAAGQCDGHDKSVPAELLDAQIHLFICIIGASRKKHGNPSNVTTDDARQTGTSEWLQDLPDAPIIVATADLSAGRPADKSAVATINRALLVRQSSFESQPAASMVRTIPCGCPAPTLK